MLQILRALVSDFFFFHCLFLFFSPLEPKTAVRAAPMTTSVIKGKDVEEEEEEISMASAPPARVIISHSAKDAVLPWD